MSTFRPRSLALCQHLHLPVTFNKGKSFLSKQWSNTFEKKRVNWSKGHYFLNLLFCWELWVLAWLYSKAPSPSGQSPLSLLHVHLIPVSPLAHIIPSDRVRLSLTSGSLSLLFSQLESPFPSSLPGWILFILQILESLPESPPIPPNPTSLHTPSGVSDSLYVPMTPDT